LNITEKISSLDVRLNALRISITINPVFISSPFDGVGGLIETGGLFERAVLINLEKTLVSILHKELEYKVEKLKNKKVRGGHAAKDQSQI